MKQLTQKQMVSRKNAWGGYSTIFTQLFEIEESDVGIKKPSYLGHCHREKEIRSENVGRKIEVMTKGIWSTWHFLQEH